MRSVPVLLACGMLVGAAACRVSVTVRDQPLLDTPGATVIGATVIVDGQVISGKVREGSGTLATETRAVPEFAALRVDLPADVTVAKGETATCTITADDNLLPVILTEGAGGTLRVFAKDSYSSRQRVVIALELPELRRVDLNGSGSVTFAGVTHDVLDVTVNGSGSIAAQGQVAALTVAVNGSGRVQAGELAAKSATVTVAGSGDVAVHATDALLAQVLGSGHVVYAGRPPKVQTAVRGSGSVKAK